ncbi:uncharacterized protein FFMR_06089 [Fusarium fujikuroi]|nr:uncharacterized protein FFMR_06089 [Fusarium fujikuroi]
MTPITTWLNFTWRGSVLDMMNEPLVDLEEVPQETKSHQLTARTKARMNDNTMPEYSQAYLDHLGEEWMTRWSNCTPSMRDYSRVALELMATITNPAIIDRLSNCNLYRLRTNAIFGVTWSTEDNHTYWPSVSTSDIVEMENA